MEREGSALRIHELRDARASRHLHRAVHQLRADLQAIGSQYVTLLAVLVSQEREARGANRIIFNGNNIRFNPEFVALEIDVPVKPVCPKLCTEKKCPLDEFSVGTSHPSAREPFESCCGVVN